MNTKVAVRQCHEYDFKRIYDLISEIFSTCEGPEVSGKKVLVKPNILMDADPSKCISTNPVMVEAMVRFLQEKGATVFVGDSPALHLPGAKCEKSGIYDVCIRTGAEWVDFLKNPSEIVLKNGKIRIASIAREVDLIISMPKFKNHELVYFTGAIKNTLGLVPGFSKAKQHALHHDRDRFSVFLVDLNEAVTPHFFLMDGIMAMEGHGPGQGTPVATGVLIGSSNPLATDIVASTIAGYDPMDIPTNAVAVARRRWLNNPGEIVYDGPEIESLIKKDFKRLPVSVNENIAVKFIKHRLHFIKKFEKRPVFNHSNCTGCQECIKICPVNAITMHPENKKWVILNDRKCIRCFCCAEVCMYNAVDIRRKIFGE
jgi:uncharacterized protein (DUF362 family)/Pyruvate/2-oxoacid:ferredoxin oxidoreductase delta subunit